MGTKKSILIGIIGESVKFTKYNNGFSEMFQSSQQIRKKTKPIWRQLQTKYINQLQIRSYYHFIPLGVSLCWHILYWKVFQHKEYVCWDDL